MTHWHKIEIVNVQTIGARSGYGEGRTREEAMQDAMRRGREIDPNAWNNGHRVFVRGGVNC